MPTRIKIAILLLLLLSATNFITSWLHIVEIPIAVRLMGTAIGILYAMAGLGVMTHIKASRFFGMLMFSAPAIITAIKVFRGIILPRINGYYPAGDTLVVFVRILSSLGGAILLIGLGGYLLYSRKSMEWWAQQKK